MESLNQWAEVWADFMRARVEESTLVFALVGLIWLLVRKKVSPQFGYVLFFLPLLKLVVWFPVELPVWMPSWNSSAVISDAVPIGYFTAEPIPAAVSGSEISQESVREGNSFPSAAPVLGKPESADPAVMDPPLSTKSASFTIPTATALLFLLWLPVVVYLALKYLQSQFRFRKVLQHALPLDNRYESLDLNQLRRQAEVKQTVRFVASDSIQTPVVWGIWRPYLIVPHRFGTEFTSDQIKWILLHELAHIRRWDLLAALFQRAVGIFFFFHPVVWVSNRTLNRLREFICDDTALVKSGISRLECGEGFLAVAEQVKRTPVYAEALLGFMEEPSLVRRRMMRILDGKRKLSVKVSLGAAAVLLLIAAVVLPSVRAGETQTDSTESAEIVADATATNAEDAKQETEKKPIIIRQYSQQEFRNLKPSQPQSEPTDSSLSSDGRYQAKVDWDTGNMVVKNQQTGETRDLTQKGNWDKSSDYAEECLFTPGNQTIAYTWFNEKKSTYELWLVDVDGTNKRVAYQEPSNWLGSIILTSNGNLLFERDLPSGEVQLRELSLLDLSSRILLDLPKGSTFLHVSKNKKYLVWHQPSGSDSNNDIFLYSIPENRQACLVQHPEDDKLVGWSPNGKWIVFKSNRLGEWSLWGMPVPKDTAESAVLLKRGTDSSVGGWISADGKYVIPESIYQQSVFLAEMDFDSGELITPPQSVCAAPSVTVSWSKNGKHLALSREVYPASQPSIYSLESKTLRHYPTKYFCFFAGFWADNDRLLIGGGSRTKDGENVACRLDIQTGEMQEILTDFPKGFVEYSVGNSYLSNPARIMLTIQKKGSNQVQIVYRDLTTEKDDEICTVIVGEMSNYNYLTNDKKWIYYMIKEGEEHVLKRISLEKHEMHDLYRLSELKHWQIMPDEQNIAFLKEEKPLESILWKLHIESGTTKEIYHFQKEVDFFAVHPDGKHLAYTEVNRGMVAWVMENFLPEEAMN